MVFWSIHVKIRKSEITFEIPPNISVANSSKDCFWQILCKREVKSTVCNKILKLAFDEIKNVPVRYSVQ